MQRKINHNISKIKAIEQKNKHRLLAVNPKLDEKGGAINYEQKKTSNYAVIHKVWRNTKRREKQGS